MHFVSPYLLRAAISQDDASANAESTAGAIHASIDRRARNKAPGFPKSLAAAPSADHPRRAVDPIANTAAAAIAVRTSDRS
ncbi:MAG: hypothetical protein WB760_34335 [Xanthobacteraceae bacterium]